MPRKKREVIEHRTFGFGSVKHRKTTDYGDALVVAFGSYTRTILLDGGDTPEKPAAETDTVTQRRG